MLVKPLTAFLVGCITVASSISAALGAPGKAGFVFGVLSTFFALGLLLRNPRRAQWAARLLLRIAGPSEVHLKVQQPVKVTAAKIRKPEPKSEPGVFTDCVLALRGMGSDKQTARWAAGQATMRLPEADFQSTFKLASQIAIGRV